MPTTAPAGVGGVEDASRRRHGGGVRMQRAQQGRQRAAHQEGRHAHESEGKRPGQRADRVLERDKECRRARERQRGEHAEHRDAGLEPRVQPHADARRGRQGGRERGASQRKAREEGAERDGDGVDLDADDPAELLHPERLVHERDDAGGEQERTQLGSRVLGVPTGDVSH